MYYELTNDRTFDYGIHPPRDRPWDLTFISGDAITQELDLPITLRTNAQRADQLPDFWDAGYPVMSKRFVAILEEAGVDNLQLFPAVVRSQVNGTEWDDYVVVNVLDCIACADFERSDYSETFPGSYSFTELVIDAEKANGSLLFRLEESPTTLLVHKRVGTHIGNADPDRELQGWAAWEVMQ